MTQSHPGLTAPSHTGSPKRTPRPPVRSPGRWPTWELVAEKEAAPDPSAESLPRVLPRGPGRPCHHAGPWGSRSGSFPLQYLIGTEKGPWSKQFLELNFPPKAKAPIRSGRDLLLRGARKASRGGLDFSSSPDTQRRGGQGGREPGSPEGAEGRRRQRAGGPVPSTPSGLCPHQPSAWPEVTPARAGRALALRPRTQRALRLGGGWDRKSRDARERRKQAAEETERRKEQPPRLGRGKEGAALREGESGRGRGSAGLPTPLRTAGPGRLPSHVWAHAWSGGSVAGVVLGGDSACLDLCLNLNPMASLPPRHSSSSSSPAPLSPPAPSPAPPSASSGRPGSPRSRSRSPTRPCSPLRLPVGRAGREPSAAGARAADGPEQRRTWR